MTSLRLLVIAATLQLAACGAPAAQVGPSSNGKNVALSPGEALVVTLPSGTDGGYLWSVTQAPNGGVLSLVAHQLTPAPASAGVGANGTESWTFEARAPGTTALTLSLARPWDSTQTAGTFALRVTVR